MSKILEKMVGGAELHTWLKEVMDNNDKDTAMEIIGESMILVVMNARIDSTNEAYDKSQSILGLASKGA